MGANCCCGTAYCGCWPCALAVAFGAPNPKLEEAAGAAKLPNPVLKLEPNPPAPIAAAGFAGEVVEVPNPENAPPILPNPPVFVVG